MYFPWRLNKSILIWRQKNVPWMVLSFLDDYLSWIGPLHREPRALWKLQWADAVDRWRKRRASKPRGPRDRPLRRVSGCGLSAGCRSLSDVFRVTQAAALTLSRTLFLWCIWEERGSVVPRKLAVVFPSSSVGHGTPVVRSPRHRLADWRYGHFTPVLG